MERVETGTWMLGKWNLELEGPGAWVRDWEMELGAGTWSSETGGHGVRRWDMEVVRRLGHGVRGLGHGVRDWERS